MFERYTENARRAIFFARYEASHLGSGTIEPEHLLLALLRESTGLAYRLLRSSPAAAEGIRSDIEAHITPVEKTSTSVDLPLGQECKRILAFASDEAERLTNEHIDSEHLLLGILRDEKSYAAELLREHGLTLDFVREKARTPELASPPGNPAKVAALERWLTERAATATAWTLERLQAQNGTVHFAIYASSESNADPLTREEGPAKDFAGIRKEIDRINRDLNCAILSHDFEKARTLSREATRAREVMRLLKTRFGLQVPPLPVPILCLEVIVNDRLSDIQQRCDDYLAQGVAEVWLLNIHRKRAYTVTPADGLRECKATALISNGALLEMNLKEIFG